MTLLLDDRLDDGANGATFVGRGALSVPAGITAPTYVAPGRLGGAALSFPSGSGAVVSLIEAAWTAGTTRYLDVFVKLSAAVTTTGNVVTLRGATDVARLGITSTNVLRLFNGTGTSLGTGAVSLPVGSWFRLSLQVVGNTATANLYSTVTSNTPTETLTGTVTGASMSVGRFGNVNGANLNGGTVQMDWPQGSNDAAPVARDDSLVASVALSPTSLTKPATLTATFTAAGGTGNYTYEVLNWGDGSTLAAQSSATVTKSILSGATNGTKTFSGRVTAV